AATALPEGFGTGMAFLPPGRAPEAHAAVEAATEETGLRCRGWRVVPTDTSLLGPRAVATLPAIWQCFFAPESPREDLERLLFLCRKRAQAAAPRGIYF